MTTPKEVREAVEAALLEYAAGTRPNKHTVDRICGIIASHFHPDQPTAPTEVPACYSPFDDPIEFHESVAGVKQLSKTVPPLPSGQERAGFKTELNYLYWSAYHSGHHDTVEGRYTDVVAQDRFTFHEDEVNDCLSGGDMPILSAFAPSHPLTDEAIAREAAHEIRNTVYWPNDKNEGDIPKLTAIILRALQRARPPTSRPDLSKIKVQLLVPTETDPFAREDLTVTDIGHSDQILTCSRAPTSPEQEREDSKNDDYWRGYKARMDEMMVEVPESKNPTLWRYLNTSYDKKITFHTIGVNKMPDGGFHFYIHPQSVSGDTEDYLIWPDHFNWRDMLVNRKDSPAPDIEKFKAYLPARSSQQSARATEGKG